MTSNFVEKFIYCHTGKTVLLIHPGKKKLAKNAQPLKVMRYYERIKTGCLLIRDGQLFNYRDNREYFIGNNRDYFIGNNRHHVLFID